jgi:hypothetical protein
MVCASKCGRLSFYSLETMELIHVTSPIHISSSTGTVGNPSSSSLILSITLLDGGRRIILRHSDETISLIDFHSVTAVDSGRRQCRVKLRRVQSIASADLEVVSIANDDSMFAIRQGHLLSLFLITETAQTIEAIQTLSLSLLTQMSFLTQQESQSDLRSQDLTSKARLTRYSELNQLTSVSPSRTLIQRARDGLLHITLLGAIGTNLQPQCEQFLLAASLNISSAIQSSQHEMQFHTCFGVGEVVCSAMNREGILAVIDPRGTVRVIDSTQLHLTLYSLVEELSISAQQRLPTENDDLDLWESLKPIREAAFLSRHLYLHETLTESCVGMFQMRKTKRGGGGGDVTTYALAISPTPPLAVPRGQTCREQQERISIFISRRDRVSVSVGASRSLTNSAIYEVVI